MREELRDQPIVTLSKSKVADSNAPHFAPNKSRSSENMISKWRASYDFPDINPETSLKYSQLHYYEWNPSARRRLRGNMISLQRAKKRKIKEKRNRSTEWINHCDADRKLIGDRALIGLWRFPSHIVAFVIRL